MKVLIACEYSGIVRDAFIAEGHDAISCDLLPTERPGPHIQGDVRPLLRERWDLVIAHPPCTYLTKARGAPAGDDDIFAAMEFFADCQNANAPMVAVENPTMYLFARRILGEPDCILQPYHFGDMYQKRTCLWLTGLPPIIGRLQARNLPRWHSSTGATPSWYGSAKKRSQSHPGMAKSMAQQWGNYPT